MWLESWYIPEYWSIVLYKKSSVHLNTRNVWQRQLFINLVVAMVNFGLAYFRFRPKIPSVSCTRIQGGSINVSATRNCVPCIETTFTCLAPSIPKLWRKTNLKRSGLLEPQSGRLWCLARPAWVAGAARWSHLLTDCRRTLMERWPAVACGKGKRRLAANTGGDKTISCGRWRDGGG